MGVLGPKKNQQLTLDNFLCHDDSNSDSDSNSIRFHPGVNFPNNLLIYRCLHQANTQM